MLQTILSHSKEAGRVYVGSAAIWAVMTPSEKTFAINSLSSFAESIRQCNERRRAVGQAEITANVATKSVEAAIIEEAISSEESVDLSEVGVECTNDESAKAAEGNSPPEEAATEDATVDDLGADVTPDKEV